MRKFLFFLGSAVYGAAAAYVTYILFKWFHGFSWKLSGRLLDSPVVYTLVLVVAAFILYIVFTYASTVVAFPLKLMRNETAVVKYVPSLLMLAAGFAAGRLPWIGGGLDYCRIAFGVAYDFILCNFVLCVVLFTWKKYENKPPEQRQ